MPKLKVEPVKATSVGTARPLCYDSGIKYDDPKAYYDKWYPYDDVGQGDIPKVVAKCNERYFRCDSGQIDMPKILVKDEPKKAKVRIENVIIKETGEL